MIALFVRFVRPCAALFAATFILLSSCDTVALPEVAAQGNGVNVILMIGDGMGWEPARAAAAAKGKWYTRGKGTGLAFQTLTGYTLETTYGTTVPIAPSQSTATATGNSALTGSSPVTGQSPVRPEFVFTPALNPGFLDPANGTPGAGCAVDPGGNIVGYEPDKGGPNPWTPIAPPPPGVTGPVAGVTNYNRNYIKCSYPDSANTATTLYTGQKSYNNAISVDLYEQDLKTIVQIAKDLGKSTGVVTSVPISHATPGAAVSSVNRRNKYDADYPTLDNILQEAIRSDDSLAADYQKDDRPFQLYLPTVMLGGGHPLDFDNSAATSTVTPKGFTYIRQSTYDELRDKPGLDGKPMNRYGYTFLERDTSVTTTNDLNQVVDGGDRLLEVAKTIDPNKGQRLLGLYGARGQNGNLPHQTANRDFSETGTDAFFLAAGANVAQVYTTQVATRDTIRPLATTIQENTQNFIEKEVKANPTLSELAAAALEVLGKDKDGFWLMVEGGDIDWALHDNHLDNLIGNLLAFDEAVQTVINWINANGGWSKNVLIVTADHDHYWTLTDAYPKLLAQVGAEELTFGATRQTPATAGYFTGSDPTKKYGWNSHSNRMPPVYFQGAPLKLTSYIGKPVEYVDNPPNGSGKVYQIPGVPGAVDQSHIFKAMVEALTAPL